METSVTRFAEWGRQWARTVDPFNLVYAAGVAILVIWLLRTSVGRSSLVRAPLRRNAVHPAAVILALMVYMLVPPYAMIPVRSLLDGHPAWQVDLAANLVMGLNGLATVGIALGLSWLGFARRLKGLGLRWATLPRDLASACTTFLAILPLFLAMVQVTVWAGQSVHGPTYRMEQHRELLLLETCPHWSLAVSIVLMAVVVAPLAEELLFRGLVQSTIRSWVGRPWAAVGLTSVFFAVIHQNVEHWPALFVLGAGMGYAYERSGSLWQPILIHVLFNGTTILSSL